MSVGLSADSLKALLYSTNATFGNQTIMTEIVDYCLGQAHREVEIEERKKSAREVVTRKKVETIGDAERWVPSGSSNPKESVRPEKLRAESKKQVLQIIFEYYITSRLIQIYNKLLYTFFVISNN